MIVVGSSGQFDAKYFNVRCVPVADPDVSNLSVRFSATLFVGLQMYTARIGQKLN